MEKKNRKSLIAQDQIDMDLMAEAELKRLKRQLRIMEGDRHAFAEEVGNKLKRQRRIIQKFRKERQNLLTDLEVATSLARKRKDNQVLFHLNHLLEEYSDNVNQVEKEKINLEEMNSQIEKVERQISALRPKDVTDKQTLEKVTAGKKAVEVLENRLETGVKKFCEILAENRKLRQELDHLLKERSSFNATWEKLLGQLQKGKKDLIDLIEQATLAFDQREQWCMRLATLRHRNNNDVLQHTNEMRELQRKLDHDEKLDEFMNTKVQKRVMRDLELKQIRRKEEIRKEMDSRLERYQNIFQQIKEYSGESDIEKLKTEYIKKEEENFALFNYINELNREIEELNESIGQIGAKILEYRKQDEERAWQQKDTLVSLREILEEATKEATESEDQYNQQEKDLLDVLEGVGRLFILVKCDEAPVLQLMGDKTKITTHNIMLYVKIFERHVTQLPKDMNVKKIGES